MERGHRGSQDSASVPGLIKSRTRAISSAMWEREGRLPLPTRLQASALRKTGRAGHDLSTYGGAARVPIIKPQRGREWLFFVRLLPAVVQRLSRQHPFLDQFLHNDALRVFPCSHTREGRPRMTVPKVICGIF